MTTWDFVDHFKKEAMIFVAGGSTAIGICCDAPFEVRFVDGQI
jgi:hypothetical protein